MVTDKDQASVSRQLLLRMARISQHAVDYATKAYQLQDVRFCLQIKAVDHTYRALPEFTVGSRDLHRPESCALQIYRGLRGTFDAAMEILECVMLYRQDVLISERSSPRWSHAARFVNSLVSLNTVALFKEQTILANNVVLAKPLWEQEMHSAPEDARISEAGSVAQEKRIARCLNVIFGQCIDIASLLLRYNEETCREKLLTNGYAVRLPPERTREKICDFNLRPLESA